MSDAITDIEIREILNENYYTLGSSGAQAIAAVWSEIAEGYFDDQCDEWGVSVIQFVSAVNDWAMWLADTGRLAKPVML